MKTRILAAVVPAVLLLGGCKKDPRPELESSVRRYVERVAEAYRTSDASLMDSLVGEKQGLKLTGLIGVKRDSGAFLDARVLELEFVEMRRDGKRWLVDTRERWYYRDRRIGTGEQLGEDSTDAYTMRYVFARHEGRWILEDLQFLVAPLVGRKVIPPEMSGRHLHGQMVEEGATRPAGHGPASAAAAAPRANAPSATAGDGGGAERAR